MHIPYPDTKEKMQRCYDEAYLCKLTQAYWHHWIACNMRKLAQKLEPQTKVGGQPHRYERLIMKFKKSVKNPDL